MRLMESRRRELATDHHTPPHLAPVLLQLAVMKKGALGAPFFNCRDARLRSALSSRRPLHFPRVQTACAHLHLGDLAVDDDARDLKVGLPRPPRLVVRVRDVVAEGDALVANEAAISLDLCHRLTLRRDELDTSHLGTVTLAVTGLQNASVAALPRREARPDVVEQLVGGRAVSDVT